MSKKVKKDIEKYRIISNNKIIPIIPLPSVKLCIKNTYPISLLNKDKETNYNGSNESSTGFKESLDSNKYISYANKKILSDEDTLKPSESSILDDVNVDNDKLNKLYDELYIFNLLYRMIKLEVWNKKNNLSFLFQHNNIFYKNKVVKGKSHSNTSQNQLTTSLKEKLEGHDDIVNLLICSLITNKNSDKNEIKNLFDSRSNDNSRLKKLNRNKELDQLYNKNLCIDDNIFNNLYNYNLLKVNSSDATSKDKRMLKRTSIDHKVEHMLSNLLKNNLSDGSESNFRKFLMSILLVNKYDFLTPKFLNRILSYISSNFGSFASNLVVNGTNSD